MEKYEAEKRIYVEPRSEARQALARVGIESVEEQDAFYKNLAEAIQEAEASRALQYEIETTVRSTGDGSINIADDTLKVSKFHLR